jgi:ABC-2 type transport system permease protein
MTTSTTNPTLGSGTGASRGGVRLAEPSFWRATYVVFRRQIRMNLRNPAWVLIGIMQPVLYLFLFGPLLKPIVSQFPGSPDNEFTFLVPGLLVQLGMFGAFFAGFGLIAEWREGVVEAERVTPASRTALLAGRLMRDMAQLLVQALILIGLGLVMGMRGDVGGIAFGLFLTLLVGGACAAASNALALTTKSEDVMAPVINMVMMPVLLLSGIMLPMTLGPEWLQRVSDFMPFRWITDAVRGAFGGDFPGNSLFWGSGWAVVLFVLALWWGTSTFRKENS